MRTLHSLLGLAGCCPRAFRVFAGRIGAGLPSPCGAVRCGVHTQIYFFARAQQLANQPKDSVGTHTAFAPACACAGRQQVGGGQRWERAICFNHPQVLEPYEAHTIGVKKKQIFVFVLPTHPYPHPLKRRRGGREVSASRAYFLRKRR